jgi:acid phosphatase (class A)
MNAPHLARHREPGHRAWRSIWIASSARLTGLLAMTICSFAAETAPAPVALAPATATAVAPQFIPPDVIDFTALISSPPARGSPEEQAEIEFLLQLQAVRTPAQANRAKEIDEEKFFVFAREALGPWFTAAALPKTEALFAAAGTDFYAINRALKAKFDRKRPPYTDPRVTPCIKHSDTGSYPSGHAMQAGLWAALLTELFPEHETAIEARAADTAAYRLIGGVHFMSDCAAGGVVGRAIARELLKQSEFRRRLDEVRQEIAAARLKAAA